MCFDDSAMHCLIHLPYFIVYMHICGSVRSEVNLGFCSPKTIHFVSGDSLSRGSGSPIRLFRLTSNPQPISRSRINASGPGEISKTCDHRFPSSGMFNSLRLLYLQRPPTETS